jgi:hypothetical protein
VIDNWGGFNLVGAGHTIHIVNTITENPPGFWCLDGARLGRVLSASSGACGSTVKFRMWCGKPASLKTIT